MKSHQEIVDTLGSHDPFEIVKLWLQKARNHQNIREPGAMLLSTSYKDQPTARVVLLKEIKSEGFVFYSNFQSEKGKHLAQNPRAAVTFYWDPLALQCRIQGLVHQLDRASSTAYWDSRPRGSQISQWISHQSEVAESRAQLEGLVQDAEAHFKNKPIPCPETWGGYILIPEKFEFWIGKENRLHDRFSFTKQDQDWVPVRLFP